MEYETKTPNDLDPITPDGLGQILVWREDRFRRSAISAFADFLAARLNGAGPLFNSLAKKLDKSGGDMTGPLRLPASTADNPSPLTIPQGVEPTNKDDGNIWLTAAGFYARIAGVTRFFWDSTSAPDATTPEVAAGTVTNRRMFSPAQLFAAARAALPAGTQAQADAGTDTVARSWSAAFLFRAARAALPAVTQAIAEAGTETVARSWSALAVRQAAVAADQEVLINSWDAASLNGLGQILIDLPTGYSRFVLREQNIRVASGTGGLSLRVGPAPGGNVDSGASDYNNVAFTVSNTGAPSRLDADVGFVRVISDGPGQSDIFFTSGSDASWSFRVFSNVFSFSTGNSFDLRSGTRNAAAFLVRRLRIGFGASLIASGSIRLYGVK